MSGHSIGCAAERSTPGFRHDEPGTAEPVWLLDQRWDTVATCTPKDLALGVDRVVVASAHPDDEALGTGATLADLAPLVDEVVVVLATDGEASHPPDVFQGGLAALRRAEGTRGLHHVAPAARLVPLALPDGNLRARADDLSCALGPLLNSRTLLLAPWQHDGHPDHEALGRAAAVAADAAGARLLQFPVWMWHWGRPDELPWSDLVLVAPSADGLHAKAAAIGEHRSQLRAAGPRPDETPLIGPHVRRRFERVVETFVGIPPHQPSDARSRGADVFEGMYDHSEDPWGFDESWYEQRKRALVTSMLTGRRYRSALEVGCATGLLTRVLAERAEHITGLDVSARALDIARRSATASGVDNVSWLHGPVPEAVPSGSFDLVVLSEIGYFLDGAQWLATLRRVHAALEPGGELVLAHWRRRTNGIPLDGPLVQRAARDALGLAIRAEYIDADVEIAVLGAGPSVAEREGLA